MGRNQFIFDKCFGRGCPNRIKTWKKKCGRKTTESCDLRAVQNDVRTHADNLALGNTDPPEQQAYTTTLRPREVVRPPMEVVARLTLTPWDQTLNYTLRTKLQPRCRGHHAEIISNCLPFGSHAGKQRPENVGAVVVVRLLAIYGGSVRLCCRASCGLCALYGSPDVIHILTWLR